MSAAAPEPCPTCSGCPTCGGRGVLRPERRCPECHVLFRDRKQGAIYCSRTCTDRALQRRFRDRRKAG